MDVISMHRDIISDYSLTLFLLYIRIFGVDNSGIRAWDVEIDA